MRSPSPDLLEQRMRLRRLILRNLVYYWRTNLAVIAGVAAAVAVLSGALLVGQSVRDSLRNLLLQRLGATEFLVSADRFFRAELAGALVSNGGAGSTVSGCAIIHLQGVLVHEGSGLIALNVNVYGVDQSFWRFHHAAGQKSPEGREALVGAALARNLGVRAGDGLLLRIETQQGIPKESLYGRRDTVGRTVRLVCGDILPAEKLGEFVLRPGQGTVYSIFVPIERLQRDLAQPARANAILLAAEAEGVSLQQIRNLLKTNFILQDAGVMFRPLSAPAGIAVESSRILLDDSIARASLGAAADLGMKASGVFSYLANSIRAGGREIPYSVITAADLRQGALNAVRGMEGFLEDSAPADVNESIWLNRWAWKDLGISRGDPVEVDYYRWQEEGILVTRTARFRLAGVVSIGGDVDTTLAPEFPGITEARSIRSWDPPFPLDLRRIRWQDEEYWTRFRATPKAFITLAKGQELWQSRFGKLSSVRIALPEGADMRTGQADIAERMRTNLDLEAAGFSVNDVKTSGLNASRGSTDFGEYFIYFSFFLIAAAILLSALFVRLGVEQRVREIGTLQATGFPMSTLHRIFLVEGAVLSMAGSLLGLFGAVAYGGLLIFGLRTWWIGAVGTQRLSLHVAWADLGLGAAAGILASLGSIAWTLRGLRRNSPRALLAGVLESALVRSRHARFLGALSSVAFAAAMLMLLGSAFRSIPDVAGFFGAGFLLLISMLSLAALYLRREHPSPVSGRGWRAFLRLGTRNAMHRPGRSLLCIALIAAATFVIVSVEAFRKDPRSVSLQQTSGTGGYPLLATSALPVIYDPNSDAGREAMGIPVSEVPELAGVKFVSFRERPGDDVSCLNLYAPQEPRILGASHAFLAGARFSFQESLASTSGEKQNPWQLLESASQDGTIPAIADANTIQYILRLSVGQALTVRGSSGEPVRLRLVAALRDSILQGELMISEANFLRVFPDQEGYRFFLLDVPADGAAALVKPLMERLADWGFSVESSQERLAAYHRVENTYLSTFQSLGLLGLVLGTAGLATVLLRNVLERRQELALLRAVGYRRQILAAIIVAENLVLMLCGLACGTICALLSIMPALHARGIAFPLAMAGMILAAVLLVGILSSFLAVVAALRSPLLDALRSE
jgi:ABC-type lipoprotein release transport system permease subunit